MIRKRQRTDIEILHRASVWVRLGFHEYEAEPLPYGAAKLWSARNAEIFEQTKAAVGDDGFATDENGQTTPKSLTAVAAATRSALHIAEQVYGYLGLGEEERREVERELADLAPGEADKQVWDAFGIMAEMSDPMVAALIRMTTTIQGRPESLSPMPSSSSNSGTSGPD